MELTNRQVLRALRRLWLTLDAGGEGVSSRLCLADRVAYIDNPSLRGIILAAPSAD